VQLAAAKDYDPLGSNKSEHPNDVGKAIDGDTTTYWYTEHYTGGNLGKQGVGLYVAASSPVAARELDIYSTTPGWSAKVMAANTVSADPGGWGRPLGSVNVTQGKEKVTLDTAGRSFRYYLLWITKVPTSGSANVNELKLKR